jgi:hypothetical protein
MAQYRTGTVSITSGSVYVSGAGTLWYSTGIQEGDLFNLNGNNGWYYISNVHSNTLLSLTAPFNSASVASESYVIHRDFLSTYKIPLMNKGSVNWPSIYNEAMRKLNIALGGDATSGSGLGLDAAYNVENIITVDDEAVILNRVSTYGGASKANALKITDENTSGPVNGTPFDGALGYIYSKHRVPLIAVTNQADTDDIFSSSDTPQVGIMGLAWAGNHDSYPSGYQNIGILGYAHDYHNTYGYSKNINVGVRAHSQRGYGLVATSDLLPAIYIEQSGNVPGMYIDCASGHGLTIDAPIGLRVFNTSYASTSFASIISARRGGMYISSLLPGTDEYPTLALNCSGGTALSVSGQCTINNYTQSGLVINAGLVGVFPALDITSRGDGIDVYGGGSSSYAIVAESRNKPAIRAIDGINLYSSDHALIPSPDVGTLVYSQSSSGLMIYSEHGWESVDWGGGGVSACECSNGVRVYNSNVMSNIPSPLEGTIIYDGTTQELYFADSTGWNLLAGGTGSSGGGTKGVSILVQGYVGVQANVASFAAPYNGEIVRVYAQVDYAPNGSDITIDLLKNDVSILGGNLITIADGAQESTVIALSESISIYDDISLDVKSIGGSVAGGNDLRVIVYFTEESEINRMNIVNVSTSPYQMTTANRYIMCNTSSTSIIINPPSASAADGIPFCIKKTTNDLNTVTFNTEVDGSSPLVLSFPKEAAHIISDGTDYNRVG